MRYVHLLLMHKEDKTMRSGMVLPMAARRCGRSVAGESRLAMVLVTSLNVMLLESGLLHIISVVQTKIFWQQRISMKLSRYSAAHTGRRPERSSAVCAAKAAATAWLCTASGRAAGRRMRGGLSVVLLGVRAQPRLNRRKIAPLPPRRLRLLLHR